MKVFTATALGTCDTQQDSCFATKGFLHGEPFIAAGVADGVGGNKGGAEAARAVILSLAAHLTGAFTELNGLNNAFRAALYEASRKIQESCTGGASTATAAIVLPHKAHVFNVGDSPAVLYSNNHRLIGCATREFSKAADLYRDGTIEKSDLEKHPFRSMLSSYVSGNPNTSRRTHGREVPLDQEDRLLLCTDGLTNVISPHELRSILAGPDAEICSRILEIELFCRAEDNASFVLIGNDYGFDPHHAAMHQVDVPAALQTRALAEGS